MNAALLWALAFFYRPSEGKMVSRDRLIAGAFFALASLYKHVVVLIPIGLALAHVVVPPPGRNRRQAAIDVALVGSVGVVVWGALFAYFACTGRLENFYKVLFTYNQYYAGSQQENLSAAITMDRIFPATLYSLIPLFFLSATGVLANAAKRNWSVVIALTALAIVTHLTICLPGHFYPHYYQLWFPFLMVGSAIGLYSMQNLAAFPCKQTTSLRATAGLTALILLPFHVSYFLKSPDEWSKMKYDRIFITTDKLAAELTHLLNPEESFFQLGSETQLYFDTKRRPPSVLADYGLFDGPLSAQLIAKTVSDLEKAKPDLLLVEEWTPGLSIPNNPIFQFIKANYLPTKTGFRQDPFYFFVRRGSALQQRWEERIPDATRTIQY